MSSDIFKIFCPSCGSGLNAKVSLIGQTRNCPKCQHPIVIQRSASEPVAPPVRSSAIVVNEPSITQFASVPTLNDGVGLIEDLPQRLVFRNKYIVMSADRIVAVWDRGKGWQVNVGNGYAPAKKNIAAIPDQGQFAFVELVVGHEEDGTGAAGVPTELHVFKVSVRGALTSLYRDEAEILSKVDCKGELTKLQKNMLLGYLRQNFMYESLSQAGSLMDSLM